MISGVNSVGLRYFNVYGPRQSPDSDYSGVISIFMARMLADQPVTIFGDGLQTRDFVFVKDVASANVKSMITMKKSACIYNCGSGLSVSIDQLYRVIGDILSVKAIPIYGPSRKSEVKFSNADIEKMEVATQWKPNFNLRDGLEKLKNYMNNNLVD